MNKRALHNIFILYKFIIKNIIILSYISTHVCKLSLNPNLVKKLLSYSTRFSLFYLPASESVHHTTFLRNMHAAFTRRAFAFKLTISPFLFSIRCCLVQERDALYLQIIQFLSWTVFVFMFPKTLTFLNLCYG